MTLARSHHLSPPPVAPLTLHASPSTIRRNGCETRSNRETPHGNPPTAAIATASRPCRVRASGSYRDEARMSIGASGASLPDVAPEDRFGLRQAALWLDRAIGTL